MFQPTKIHSLSAVVFRHFVRPCGSDPHAFWLVGERNRERGIAAQPDADVLRPGQCPRAVVMTDRPTSSAERQRQCSWCDSDFRARDDGGKAQRFCRSACRQAFHRALRTWAWGQWQAGQIKTSILRRHTPAATDNRLIHDPNLQHYRQTTRNLLGTTLRW